MKIGLRRAGEGVYKKQEIANVVGIIATEISILDILEKNP